MVKTIEGIIDVFPLVLDKNRGMDTEGVRENIEFLGEKGINGVFIFGSMGEFFAVNAEEFNKVVDLAVDACSSNKMICVVGTHYQNSRECIRRTKYAEDAGADAALIMPPYYLPPTPDAIYNHYKLVNDSVDKIQIMAYNNPAIGVNLTPEIWDRLLKLDRIKALKESNDSLIHMEGVLNKISSKINVLPGFEPWLLPAILFGAKGLMSIFALALPELVIDYYNACKKRDLAKAIPLCQIFVEAAQLVTPFNEVAYNKYLAELGGRKAGPPRFPYLPLDKETQEKLRNWMRKTKSVI